VDDVINTTETMRQGRYKRVNVCEKGRDDPYASYADHHSMYVLCGNNSTKENKTSGLNINSAVHTAFNHGENTTRPTSKYHRTLTITLDREAYENAKATGIYMFYTVHFDTHVFDFILLEKTTELSRHS